MTDLSALRGELDAIDHTLVEALARRARLIHDIAEQKAGDSDAPIRDDRREAELLHHIGDLAREAGLDSGYVRRLYRQILDHSVRVQELRISDAQPDGSVVRVAYQGREGSWSSMAAAKHFEARHADADLVGMDTFSDILGAVAGGQADYAVLPIENTIAGSINEAYDLLATHDLKLVGEEIQPVEHCLLGLADVPLERIRRVYSQVPALAQCTHFLRGLDNCIAMSWTDTAMSAAKVREDDDLSQAAIASEAAGERYGLTVLARNIADDPNNHTRFVVVARTDAEYDLRIPCKTSIVFGTRHQAGALLGVLNVLADHGLSLCKLESRPRPGTPWAYRFYADLQGNARDPNVALALREAADVSRFLRVLGTYPSRTTERPVEEERPHPGLI
jgi:chorismate mutase / prephenate dehydratase